jgi:phosphoenolpyruvate carboxykinase (ATP)
VYNRPFEPGKFDQLYARLLGFLQGRDVFVQDVYAGADVNYRLPVRIVTELAWHSHFVRNMFILPESLEEYKRFVPEFTIMVVPSSTPLQRWITPTARPSSACLLRKNWRSSATSAYAGEIKKSVFTMLNYLLPLEGVLSMHCSANVSPDDPDDVALFFGLSGTGKTTLSADPTRRLIGDDEHGWSDEGVFNFEGGCYAKVIGLSESAEPEILRHHPSLWDGARKRYLRPDHPPD